VNPTPTRQAPDIGISSTRHPTRCPKRYLDVGLSTTRARQQPDTTTEHGKDMGPGPTARPSGRHWWWLRPVGPTGQPARAQNLGESRDFLTDAPEMALSGGTACVATRPFRANRWKKHETSPVQCAFGWSSNSKACSVCDRRGCVLLQQRRDVGLLLRRSASASRSSCPRPAAEPHIGKPPLLNLNVSKIVYPRSRFSGGKTKLEGGRP
jgi:hypothetical protein